MLKPSEIARFLAAFQGNDTLRRKNDILPAKQSNGFAGGEAGCESRKSAAVLFMDTP